VCPIFEQIDSFGIVQDARWWERDDKVTLASGKCWRTIIKVGEAGRQEIIHSERTG